MKPNLEDTSRTRSLVIVLAAVAIAVIAVAAWVSQAKGRKAPDVQAAAQPAAPKPPPPPPQEAEGATKADVTLPPQPAPLKAWVSGSTDAKLQEGGSLEILVLADGKVCNGKRYHRESHMGEGYALSMACEVDVRAGVPAVFSAQLSVDKGTAGPLKLRVRYER